MNDFGDMDLNEVSYGFILLRAIDIVVGAIPDSLALEETILHYEATQCVNRIWR